MRTRTRSVGVDRDSRAGGAARDRHASRTAARAAALLALAVAGLTVIALPDSGARLVTFSETHGPSAQDAVGLVLLLAAWLPVPVLLIRRRRLIPPRTWAGAGVAAAVAAAALATAIRSDLGWWWAPVAVLLVVQAVLVGVALAGGRTGP